MNDYHGFGHTEPGL